LSYGREWIFIESNSNRLSPIRNLSNPEKTAEGFPLFAHIDGRRRIKLGEDFTILVFWRTPMTHLAITNQYKTTFIQAGRKFPPAAINLIFLCQGFSLSPFNLSVASHFTAPQTPVGLQIMEGSL
jgi:hypothetical protein